MIKILGVNIVSSVRSDACSGVASFNPACRCCVGGVVYYTAYRLNNFNSQDFNQYPFLTYIYITCIILIENRVIFKCYGMTATKLTTFVL
jgi:hypothetical protein